MSDDKGVKTLINGVTLAGLTVGIDRVAKSFFNRSFSDPSSSFKNFVLFSVALSTAIALKDLLQEGFTLSLIYSLHVGTEDRDVEVCNVCDVVHAPGKDCGLVRGACDLLEEATQSSQSPQNPQSTQSTQSHGQAG